MPREKFYMQVAPTELTKGSPVRVFADGLFRHSRIFAAVLIIVLLSVAAWTLLAKKQYRSEMKLLLENNRSNAVITPDRSATPTVTEITEPQLNSELEVLDSEDVLGAVADPSWATLSPSAKGTPEALKLHEKRLADFRKRLKIDPARKSNVITVSLTAPSPAEATATLGRFSSAYLTHRKLLSRPSGTSNFFADEAHRYQEVWEQANRQLVEFQQQNHLVSVSQAEEALSKTLSNYEDDLQANRSSLSELNGRVSASSHAAVTVAQRQPTQRRVIFNQASVDQMRGVLVQLQNRRTELLTRYKPTDRLVEEVDQQIANTTASMNAALALKGSEDTTDVNPAWQQVQSALVQGRIERQALTAKASSLQSSISDLRGRLSQLQALDVAFNALEEKADQARSNFEVFSEKRDQAQIEDAMDERKLINIAVAESPTSTFSPASPKPLLIAALGVLTALFLASGAFYLAESSRTSVASARELESLSRYPVLATVPDGLHLAGRRRLGLGAPAVLIPERDRISATGMIPAMQTFRNANES
jgi:polysaccharide biosynthesis protein PslE